jgi:hypothetical protein
MPPGGCLPRLCKPQPGTNNMPAPGGGRRPYLPRRKCWRSTWPVTHGDVWLPFLLILIPASPHAEQLVLRAAVSAYLGRYRGQTRIHTESDLRVFLRWCTDQDLNPLAAVRADIERYLRWLQDVRQYQPSTVSRRLSVVVGFYRVCVIDQILAHSQADYVRRPTVPAESPHPRPGPPAGRSPHHHRPTVHHPQRLRPGRPPRPARATDLRSLRNQHR